MRKPNSKTITIKRVATIIDAFNLINSTVLTCVILLIGYLSFDLSGNEEQYMLYAKQFMDPDWISSRYLNEFPGTRVVYQYIVGFFLKYFSFEFVHFAFRGILCLLLALPLGRIYKTLKINNIQILLHLPVLFLFNQSLFADSWMFVSVEPKGFAYVFVLFSVYYYLIGNFRTMLIYLVLASYFHILVGGYAFIFFLLCLFIYGKTEYRLKNLKLLAVYIICLLPFILYLKAVVVDTVVYSPNVDWIYSYFRHPHHIGLFKSLNYFYSKHFYGILLSVFALLFGLYFLKRNKDEQLGRLTHFVIISLLGVLVWVIIAYFDTDGVFIKYYPFRINTLTTFLLTLLIAHIFFSVFRDGMLRMVQIAVLIISMAFIFKLAKPTANNLYAFIFEDEHAELIDVGNYIKQNTTKEAVILSFMNDLSLNRRMERDRFVVYKFIPADMNAIPEWYERELFKRKISSNIDVIAERRDRYRIDYFLSREVIDNRYLELQYSNSKYHFYKIIN